MKPLCSTALVGLVALACFATSVSEAETRSCDVEKAPPGLSEAEKAEFKRETTRRTVRELLGISYAIFSGEVVAIEDDRARFRLERLWKGDLPPEFTMASGGYRDTDGTIIWSSSDYTFAAGRKYLVFARASGTRYMEARPCAPTGDLTYSADVIEVLNALAPIRPKQ